ncbi:hypothetical protein [Rubrivirga sp.]|uniref:hypothetical protein n=1 Tax=Rubrivirga sp. TaxID=1885344 RepID=UPI003C7126E3
MLRLVALSLVCLLVACDGSQVEGQRLFEDQALLAPASGVTQTEADGTVTSRDPDDWRIGPAYANQVTILSLPSPNPVQLGEALSFVVDTQGVPGGLRLVVRSVDPVTRVVDLLRIRDPEAERPEAAASGFYPFAVSVRQLAIEGPRLYRVVLVTGNGGIVSYGDVEVVG